MSAETLSPRPMWVARLPGLVPVGVVARHAVPGALLWAAVFGLITWIEVVQFGQEYPTAADRARLVATMGTDVGMQAVFGPARQIDTVAGYVATHLVGVLSIVGAVWGLLAGTRLLRGEEEAGRWEPLLAGPTTRAGATAAAVAGLGVGLAAMWVLTAALYVAIGRLPDAGFPVGASLFAALASVAAAGMFLAVGAVCSQLAATRRQATGLAAAVFAAVYLIRVVAYGSTTLGWLRWASPLAWVDELRPLIGGRMLPLIPIAGLVAALVTLAIVLAGRRDLGAGLLRAHDTAAARTWLLGGPFGLAVRLGRGAALGWIGGLAVGGFLVGVMAKGTAEVWANQSGGMFVNLTGAQGGAIFLGIIFLVVAFLRLGYRLDKATVRRTVEFYLARTSHGSTLSRLVCAWVTARADRTGSWSLFTQALDSDLADIQGGTTREGIHLGAMAGTVDMLLRCYTGLETRNGTLWLHPTLPPELGHAEFQITYRNHTIRVQLTPDTTTLQLRACAAAPIQVRVNHHAATLHAGQTYRFNLTDTEAHLAAEA